MAGDFKDYFAKVERASLLARFFSARQASFLHGFQCTIWLVNSQSWRESFEAELRTAEAARQRGNEGMARVCARRAAGIAVGEFFQRNSLPDPTPSAYDRLKALGGLETAPYEVQELSRHFLVRNTPEFTLPIDADLIAEARKLAELLLGR